MPPKENSFASIDKFGCAGWIRKTERVGVRGPLDKRAPGPWRPGPQAPGARLGQLPIGLRLCPAQSRQPGLLWISCAAAGGCPSMLIRGHPKLGS